MIIKELDPFIGGNKFEEAGRKAEEQMAFYLERKFHKRDDILVINNLRFPTVNSFAQIDHLILTNVGFIVIECKSVASGVKYNEKDEWNRLWDNHWQGMPSPVQQVKLQIDALRELLHENCDKLREKLLGLKQRGFRNFPIDYIVAISDSSKIIRPEKDIHEGKVMKAEHVSDKIIEIYDRNAREFGLIGKMGSALLSPADLKRICYFFKTEHVPLIPKAPKTEAPTPPAKDVSIETKPTLPLFPTYSECPECKGKIAIVWGAKFKNYYWHCDGCNKNISINHKCLTCKEKLRIRKDKSNYQIYCEPCDFSAHYFTE